MQDCAPPEVTTVYGLEGPGQYGSVAVANLDGAGLPELVTANHDFDGGNGAVLSTPPGATGAVHLAAADVFVGDGVVGLALRSLGPWNSAARDAVLVSGERLYDSTGRIFTEPIGPASTPVAILVSANGSRPTTATGAGDLNADGSDDLWYAVPTDSPVDDAVYLLHGPRSGTVDVTAAAAATYTGPGGRAGTLLEAADFDGDGVRDLLVGAELAGDNGEAYLVFDPQPVDGDLVALADATWASSDPGIHSYLGNAGAAGDLDGDGTDDPIVAARFLHSGMGGVFVLPVDQTGTRDVETETTDAVVGTGQVGRALALGDANGDGQVDLWLGRPTMDSVTGRISLILGPVRGNLDADADAAMVITNTCNYGANAGHHLATGDIDGDGMEDLLAGVPFYDGQGGINPGQVWLIRAADLSL